MDLRPFSLKLAPLLAFAVLAAASSVEAQRSATNGWQSIIFSSPGTNEISSDPTSLSTQPAQSPDSQGLFQDTSPVPSFNDFSPGPAPMPREGRRVRNSSDQSQNWVFMTPAEIMGVAPDQILQTQGRDAKGDQASPTSMERYLEGQKPSAKFQTGLPGNPASTRNFWSNGKDQTKDILADLFSSGSGNSETPMDFSRYLDPARNNNSFASAGGDSVWSKLLGTPAPAPAPNAAQQRANMDQFMQLLNPGSAPAAPALTLPGETTSLKVPMALPDSDSTQPLVNPVGASFAPLSSGIGQPSGLTPLPGVTRPAGIPPAPEPAWAPQPAPWMSQTLQPFAVPRSKF